MKDQILKLCEQIIAAVNSVYTKGCDDVAMNNVAQLRGIWQSANKIERLIKEEDNNA